MTPPVALTIAGTDSGGGAGVAADLKTFAAHGVWGTCAVTAVTAQNTLGVTATEVLAPALVTAQMVAVATDFGVNAVKTGMLGSPGVVEAVAAAVETLRLHPLVVDPVVFATSGAPLITPDGLASLRRALVPQADLLTPNLAEAAALAGWADPPSSRAGVEDVARAVLDLGPAAVLVTGGHLRDTERLTPPRSGGHPPFPGSEAADLLLRPGDRPVWISAPRLDCRHTHGTGCVLSAAITARLARGEDLVQAIEGGKAFVTAAIAAGLELGSGPGPVNPSFGPCPP